MKTLRLSSLLTFLLFASSLPAETAAPQSPLIGGWRPDDGSERVMIITSNYWAQAIYSRESGQFVRTFGGTQTTVGEIISGRIEFDSEDRSQVGVQFSVRGVWDGAVMILTMENGSEEFWTRIDDGDAPLAGTWRIGGRHAEGAFTEMPLGARRTLKLLSGTRFQWVAMNVETGEFSGTGGGTYTFENGKYTEHIEFFSRDGSRVGAKLGFDGEVTGDSWRHRGLSSRGEPIDETWVRFEPASK